MLYDNFPRTVVRGLKDGVNVNSTLSYRILVNDPSATSNIRIQDADGMNTQTLLDANPDVDFTDYECAMGQVLNLPSSFTFVDNGVDDIVLRVDITDELCDALPDVADEGDPPIFG